MAIPRSSPAPASAACHRHDGVAAALAAAALLALAAVPALAADLPGDLDGPGAELRIEPASLRFTTAEMPDIYVEIDWMEDATHSHRPSRAVLDEVEATFAAAGYRIHLELSDPIPHAALVALTGPPSLSAEVDAIRAEWSQHLDDDRWHYSLWAHNHAWYGTPSSSSGYADLPGRVHLVTLGSFAGQTGTFSNQVGTFIHELGHNLGQRHGGSDNGNYKPNYLSVMNYLYQLDGVGPGLLARGFAASAAGFDDFGYSHGLLGELDEARLDETRGLGLGKGVDWDCDGVLEREVGHDVQARSHCTSSGALGRFRDFDNWSSLASFVRTGSTAGAPGPGPGGDGAPCATWEAYRPQFERIQRLRARGVLPADGPRPRLRQRLAAGRAAATFVVANDGPAPLAVTALELDVATPWIHWEPQAPLTIAAGEAQAVHLRVDLAAAAAAGGGAAGELRRELRLRAVAAGGDALAATVEVVVETPDGPAEAAPRAGFYTLTPCRVVDTRGGLALAAGADFWIPVGGSCGVPADARAVAVNVTAVAVGAEGWLSAWPADQPFAATTAVAFGGAGARASAGVYGLAADGTGRLAVRSSAPVHLLVDVAGYFY